MKRYVSIFLALLTVFSALPVQAFADDVTPVDDIYAIGDIEILEDEVTLTYDPVVEEVEDSVEDSAEEDVTVEEPVEELPLIYMTSATYIGGGVVEASWNEVSGATHYKVYVAEENSSVYKSVAVTQNIYCSFALENGTYKIRVKALVNGEWTSLADCPYRMVTATVASENPSIDVSDAEDITQPLGTCDGITATVCEYNLDISWETVDSALFYTVYYRELAYEGYSTLTVKDTSASIYYYPTNGRAALL